jgi:alkanesulfonate monooxygenase SsuD/methylene tetrahydromethanopterin reductase-like flavin-dependent oxidoreductase (luciferase family)
MLREKAASSERTPEELEAIYKERRLLHGTYDQAAEQVAAYAAEGVARIYLQHFSPLNEIDTEVLAPQLHGLRG